MRLLITVFVGTLCYVPLWGQNAAIAENYFDQGNFDKALAIYQRLVQNQPHQPKYVLGLVKTHQQLSQFSQAEELLKSMLDQTRIYPLYFIALADNFNKQWKVDSAQFYINRAVQYTFEQPNYTISIGKALTDLNLLTAAKDLYIEIMARYPDKDYRLQLARVYGELGDLTPMFDTYLSLMESSPKYIPSIKRYFETYITKDKKNQGNILLKNTLLNRLSQNQNPIYNDLLSWLFVQQKEFGKAFAQQKALYLRQGNNIKNINNLAREALLNEQAEIAKTIFNYVLAVAADPRIKLSVSLEILGIERELKLVDKNEIDLSYQKLIADFPELNQTQLILDYSEFLAFNLNDFQRAISQLNQAAEKAIKPFDQGRFRLLLGDILVYNKRYNEALVNYALVQGALKNDDLAQEAKFKEAQTSYFRGDFDWAQSQLKILKSSTSQKIANDAIALHVLINENTLEDSTQTALKKYAAAELLIHQNQYSNAITTLQELQTDPKLDRLADDVMHTLGLTHLKIGNHDTAKRYWKSLIETYPRSIYKDDALFQLSALMMEFYNDPETAKIYLENIIFNHPDSIYFVTAQNQYRQLRGDQIN